VQWLENQGKFPFEHHHLTSMHGVMRAVAADFTGHGGKDILAVSYLSAEEFPQRKKLNLDSIILLEQTGPGRYVRHSLETVACDHFTCAVGDLFDDGIQHLVTGSFTFSEDRKVDEGVSIWSNRSRPVPARK
jgi:hypothetical protein